MSQNFSYNPTDNTSDRDQLIKLSSNADVVGDFYGLIYDVNEILTRGSTTAEARSYGVAIVGDKDGQVAYYGDCAWLRITGSNYDANAETFNVRGLNCAISNRDGGVVGELSNIISISLKQGSTTAIAKALSVDAQGLSADTADEFGGIDVALNREGGAATKEYGIKIRTRGSVNTAVHSAIRVEKGTDYGFTNLLAVDAAASLGIVAKTSHTVSHVIPIDIGGVTYYIPIGTVVS